MTELKAFEYKTIITEDGSPTLSLAPTWEHMHALEGAFSETQYIYQPTIEKAFKAVQNPVFLSLGLGIGYNEMLIAFESLHRGQMPARIASYESVRPLRENFSAWLEGKPAALTAVYDSIAALYAESYKHKEAEAKALLLEFLKNGKLELLGALETAVPPVSHGILFDAFSHKTSPELWTPEFLDQFFTQASAVPCFVSTYACNGPLKQALRKQGFALTIQKGYGKKSQSTFAHR